MNKVKMALVGSIAGFNKKVDEGTSQSHLAETLFTIASVLKWATGEHADKESARELFIHSLLDDLCEVGTEMYQEATRCN